MLLQFLLLSLAFNVSSVAFPIYAMPYVMPKSYRTDDLLTDLPLPMPASVSMQLKTSKFIKCLVYKSNPFLWFHRNTDVKTSLLNLNEC
ncbi:hypothetical protein L596_021031 [Steinernema carpocapsae]|uniref:Secreted protein n=1 Tax=Steinernema carpocapsae TaxID=34508 RepID=A0A4U5MV96_STECR|nr:hypothetical protein L596_021031 [Steinernema carpocapsae]